MLLNLRTKNPNALMILGLFAIVIGNCARYLPRIAHVSENLTDATQGFFLGIGIGLLLLQLLINRRNCQPG